MLDIKFIRENAKKVEEAAKNKGYKVDISKLLNVDDKRKELIQKIDNFRSEQKKLDKSQKDKGKEIKEAIKKLEPELLNIESEFQKEMSSIPNIPTSDTPVGKDESENKVIKEVGEKRRFDFDPLPHWEIGKNLDLIDNETAAKVVGSRFTYLKNELVILQFAIIKLAFDVLINATILGKIIKNNDLKVSAKPFVPVIPPVMIRPEVMGRMARLEPREERYHIESDDLYLVGSAEHTLGPMLMDTVINAKDLPLRFVGYSTSFRREAGTYGKDTKGILRVHQFDKVEMESFTDRENSISEQDFFVAIQEYLVSQLGLPYRVVAICTGDMGGPDARQIDIETWMPGQNSYRETHTADLMTDYQSRRLKTRYKDLKTGKTELTQMNDATVFALGRILIAILENYQQKDGSIEIPKVLQKYCGFEKIAK